MSIQCNSCNQQSRDGALLCEFCKTPFNKAPRAGGSTPSPRPPAAQPRRWSTSTLIVAGLVGAVVGFAARGRPGVAPGSPVPALAVVTAPAAAQVVAAAPTPAAVEKAEPAREQVAPVAEAIKTPVIALAAEPPERAAPVQPSPLSPPTALRSFTVPYTAREGSANRVIIQVTFNDSITVPMALDTGAPGTIISTGLAERLGVLRPNEGRLVTIAQGIGGQSAARVVVLDSLAVDKARSDFVLATVVSRMSDAFEGLVGMDFVAGYSIELDTQHKLLVLKELPSRVGDPGGHDERWWRETFAYVARQKLSWARLSERLGESLRLGNAPPGMNIEDAKALADLATEQNREIEVLAGKLEHHASRNSVPREWRSY